MHPNALLERMDSFFSLLYNLDKRYFAPLELDFSISLYPWFSNQDNRYFAPSELGSIKPHRGDTLVRPSVS